MTPRKPLKLYIYKNCDTCRRALRFLDAEGVEYRAVPIRETPPSRAELRRMLDLLGGDLRRLFNTSGQDYRALGLKDRLPSMRTGEALSLLASNGNLVKRPFALSETDGAVGFDEAAWRKKFL
jgi:arsenate reductase (glutaredoxin)